MPRFKVPKYVLIIILVLTAAFFFYFPSYSRYRELKIEAERLEGQLKVMQQQIQDLQREKQLMRTDKSYLESVIRKELGLVEPGEVVYEFEKKSGTKTNTPASQTKAVKQAVSGTPKTSSVKKA